MPRSTPSIVLLVIAVAFFAVAVIMVASAVVGTRERARVRFLLFEMDPSEMRSISLHPPPPDFPSPTSQSLTLSSAEMRTILESIREMEPTTINHPVEAWRVVVRLWSRRGNATVVVIGLRDGGAIALLRSADHDGWSLGEFRADRLGREVLGVLLGHATTTPAWDRNGVGSRSSPRWESEKEGIQNIQ